MQGVCMAKKLRSFRALSLLLAVLTTIAFIVACGDGTPIDFDEYQVIADDAAGNMKLEMEDDKGKIWIDYKPPQPPTQPSSSSDGEEPESSSGGEQSSSDSGSVSSSSEGQSSDAGSSNSSSSGGTLPSSSSDSPYILTCKVLSANSSFPAGKIPKEKRPELKCTEKANGNVATLDQEDDVAKWTNNGSIIPWNSMTVGEYKNIVVKIEKDAPCANMEATCEGTITITGPSSSSYVPPPPPPPPPPGSSSSSINSQSSSSKASSSSANNSGTKGPCSKDGKNLSCRWNSTTAECQTIDSQYGYVDKADSNLGIVACTAGNCTCENLIKNCDNFGYMYDTANCSGSPIGKNGAVKGCCRWNPSTEPNVCWTVANDADWNNCGDKVLTGSACPNNGTCPTK